MQKRRIDMLARWVTAVRVTNDPISENNGLFYLYSDHLGSASAMQKDDGSSPIVTRYLPLGGYRTGSGPNEVTDRGFTGHKQNAYIKLIDMRARWYDPAIGRFISPDTIVPDPTNPQSFNRYSYVENRPLVFTDPTGHCSFDPQSPHDYYHCLEQASDASLQSGVAFDYLSQFDWGSLSPEDINQIWFYFVLQEQKTLVDAYGLRDDGSSFVAFGNFAETNKVSPISQKELVSMMRVGRHAVDAIIENFAFGNGLNTQCSCNSLVGAYFDLKNDINRTMPDNSGYVSKFSFADGLPTEMIEGVVLYTNNPNNIGSPLHGAIMSVPDYDNPLNSVILQVDGNATISGIFYTTVSNNNYYGLPLTSPYFLYPKG
ncbi:MAG: RHS repeat-associated core domain-containing protein [Ardenticatenaceae bacterium]|nr:RHS repeat-associated core domain-containing protein [Ardenticatenaceae bacterium]